MNKVEFSSGTTILSEGLSHELARGLTVSIDGNDITQEGLGIGAVACKMDNYSYFASNSETRKVGINSIEKTFLLDTRAIWYLGKKKSESVTQFIERATDFYMKSSSAQKGLLAIGTALRKTLNLHCHFEKAHPLAKIVFQYTFHNSNVDVKCTIKKLEKKLNRVFVLNELGADFFNSAYVGDRKVPIPSGWNYIEGNPFEHSFLYPEKNKYFYISKMSIPSSIRAKFLWGRERAPDLCWAGFEFEFEMNGHGMNPLSFEYSVAIKQG